MNRHRHCIGPALSPYRVSRPTSCFPSARPDILPPLSLLSFSLQSPHYQWLGVIFSPISYASPFPGTPVASPSFTPSKSPISERLSFWFYLALGLTLHPGFTIVPSTRHALNRYHLPCQFFSTLLAFPISQDGTTSHTRNCGWPRQGKIGGPLKQHLLNDYLTFLEEPLRVACGKCEEEALVTLLTIPYCPEQFSTGLTSTGCS